ncbi:MAG: beta-lactamase family protein, partial [Chloroflexi bacterium]|nr:beta-lactamase family protein [Chloroflexota bacterium]
MKLTTIDPGHPVEAGRIVKTGELVPELAQLDQLLVRFMTEHKVPGAALAVMQDGQMAYSRGFGWGDVQTLEPVQPASVFRIASVSKPFTAVGILRLVEEGKLSLTSKAFEVLEVEPFLEGTARPDPRVTQITIQQLLNHSGGWNREKSGDPMFFPVRIAHALGAPAPAEPAQIIRWVAGRPLDTNPGQAYAYSNFGYCVLGRIIEKLSGLSYETYIRQAVLQPLGITSMRIGKTRSAGRAPGEVVYYPVTDFDHSVFEEELNQRVPVNYGSWYLEAMDSHGGWIASAPDLVRFAAAFDHLERGGVLSPESVITMFACPPAPLDKDAQGKPAKSYYACGWAVDLPDGTGGLAQQHHNGMLDGTASVLRRRSDGICWSVLFNSALGRK